MTDKHIDFQRLARQATQEAHDDIRASRWCSVKLHQWTKWQIDIEQHQQSRWCFGCGKTQYSQFTHNFHIWQDDGWGRIVGDGSKVHIGKYYDQTCKICGDKRRKCTYTGHLT